MSSTLGLFIWLHTIQCITSYWFDITTLPTSNSGMAVGSLSRNGSGSIYIIGGRAANFNLTEYSIDSNTFTVIEPTPLTSSFDSLAQSWTQQNDIVFLMKTTSVAAFDLTNLQYSKGSFPAVPEDPGTFHCLASSNDYLYVTGGYSQPDLLQVMRISTGFWTVSSNRMNRGHIYHSCVVQGSFLYVFGGIGHTSTERAEITTRQWEYSVSLIYSVTYSRAVSCGNQLFVLGGYGMGWTDQRLNIAQVIDPVNLTISVQNMPYAVDGFGTACFEQDIYVFGGLTSDHVFYYTEFTENPTTDPSESPTRYPSKSPTLLPTLHPTVPTRFPTLAPTFAPTEATLLPSSHPSDEPTKDPSHFPTLLPTLHPRFSTLSSTITTTEHNALMTTVSDTFTTRIMEYEQAVMDLENLYRTVVIAFGSTIVMIGLAAWIDSTFVRINDYLNITHICGIGFQILDMISDCFFTVNISIESRINTIYWIPTILSGLFIVFPASLTIVQLYRHSSKHWLYASEQVRGWLSYRAKLLYLLSTITGSSFAAVSLVNSYIFQLELFDMGLTDKQILAFAYKRVYSVVLFENVPQICLQIWYLVAAESNNPITISSIVFSLISIIASVMSMVIQKRISVSQGYVSVSMKITGSTIQSNANNCKTMRYVLEERLALLVGVHKSVVQVIKPTQIQQGFTLTVNFNFNDVTKTPVPFHKILMEAEESGELQKIVQQSWKLTDEPMISDITYTLNKSKIIGKTEKELVRYMDTNNVVENHDGENVTHA
eukprot:233167_1